MDKATLSSIQLNDSELDEHKRMCEFGIARTNIKLGNFKKGVKKSKFSNLSVCIQIQN